jgi:hypothetical protein
MRVILVSAKPGQAGATVAKTSLRGRTPMTTAGKVDTRAGFLEHMWEEFQGGIGCGTGSSKWRSSRIERH